VRRLLERALRDRAVVRNQDPFAASDISEPEPDVMVVPVGDYWRHHPTRAFLVVEVARSSLAKDAGPKATLYGLAEVDEYWIVDHVHGVIEVHRDREGGTWRRRSTYARGETTSMLAFPDVSMTISDVMPPD
jgi:Uma2 family endonuclease